MNRPTLTATNHTLPFEKLSPEDFERLCLWLVNAEGYERAEHYGQGGHDQGRDIVAFQQVERWYFQCKRYKELGASLLKAEVDKLAKLPAHEQPHGVHFVTNANVSAQSRLAVEQHCQTKGFQCRFWAHTELDERVKRHAALVSEFFFSLPDASATQAARVAVSGDRNIIVMGNADGLTALTGDGNTLTHSNARNARSRKLLIFAILFAASLALFYWRANITPAPEPTPPMIVIVKDAQGQPVTDAVVEIDALPGKQFLTKPDGAVAIENIPRQPLDRIGITVSKNGKTATGNLAFPNPNSDHITLP